MKVETSQSGIKEVKEKISSSSQPNIGVMLTYQCNGRCIGCLAGMDQLNRITDRTFMSDDIVNTIIYQLHDINGGYKGKLSITGGEPSLHPKFNLSSALFLHSLS